MLQSISVVILTLIGCVLSVTAATAHPKLVKSSPAADAVVADSPKELRLSFSEDLVPKFSGAEVKNHQGQKVEIGSATPNSADKKQLVVPVLTPLSEGVYQVDWHAVAADTHRIQGSYSFTVKR